MCVLLSVKRALLSCPLLLFPCFCERAGLKEGVTDEGLRALASAACGGKLTSLALLGESCCVPVCELMVGSVNGRGHAGCVLLWRGLILLSCLHCLLYFATKAQGCTRE